MSADGFIYVDEVIEETYRKQLDKAFGSREWKVDSSAYNGVWRLSSLPKVMKLNIIDSNTEEVLGTIEVTNKFDYNTEPDWGDVEVEPVNMDILENKTKHVYRQTRKFDGKVYQRYWHYNTKKLANAVKERLQKQNLSYVRVVKEPSKMSGTGYHYVIYTRLKQKPAPKGYE